MTTPRTQKAARKFKIRDKGAGWAKQKRWNAFDRFIAGWPQVILKKMAQHPDKEWTVQEIRKAIHYGYMPDRAFTRLWLTRLVREGYIGATKP